MKDFFKKILGSNTEKQSNEEVATTVQKESVEAVDESEESVFDMAAWQEKTNELIKQGASALFQMLDGDEWVDAYLQGVPTEDMVECRFYYVHADGVAYSGQNLQNPSIVTDGYIERTMDMAQAIRELYLHFKAANMQPPSSILIGVSKEGQFNMSFAYDEDTSDADAFFNIFEDTQFNNLVK